MKKFIFIFIILIIGFFFLGLYRTWFVLHSRLEHVFLAAQVPNPLPEGFYKGTITSYHGNWKGKNFNPVNSFGDNIFLNQGKQVMQYHFITSVGKGLQDTNTVVMKLDYNNDQNPWWIKPVLEEIVEVRPNYLLGKLHIRIIPNVPFSLGYFRLTR